MGLELPVVATTRKSKRISQQAASAKATPRTLQPARPAAGQGRRERKGRGGWQPDANIRIEGARD
eukprot:11208168-Lingulodinium_polyedra.AAC.1